MSILINLTPIEEARISAAAKRTGQAPEAFTENLIREHLPAVSLNDELTQKLQARQGQDRVHLMPTRPAAELFAMWDHEALHLSDEERDAEDRLWEDVQRGINETRARLGMRQL